VVYLGEKGTERLGAEKAWFELEGREKKLQGHHQERDGLAWKRWKEGAWRIAETTPPKLPRNGAPRGKGCEEVKPPQNRRKIGVRTAGGDSKKD